MKTDGIRNGAPTEVPFLDRPFPLLDRNFWVLDSETTPQEIASLCFLDRVPEESQLRERIARLEEWFPRLAEIPDVTRRSYQSQQLRHDVQLEVVPVSSLTRASAEALASARFSAGLSDSEPQWRFVLYRNEQSAEGEIPAALLMLLHHGFVDGLGGLEILSALTDEGVVGKGKTPYDRETREKRVPPPPASNAKLGGAWRAALRELRSAKLRGPLSGQNSAQRGFRTVPLELTALESFRTLNDVSLNDVYLAIVTAAVRRYEQQFGSQPIRHRAIVPLSLRPLSARRALGNFLTGVALRLPASWSDAADLVNQIREETAKLKSSGTVALYTRLGILTASLPVSLARWICDMLARRTSFICTNMPESVRARHLAGATITENFGFPALLRGHGVGFSLITYANRACLSFVFDPAIVTDADTLANFVRYEAEQFSSPSRSASEPLH